MDKVKLALVGAGGISQVVRLPILKSMEDVELVALCDGDEAKVSFIADKFEINRVYYDVENLLRREKLDGILICTPNNFHYPMSLASLERGVATLVEKPVALNATQAKKIAKKARERKTPLIIGMNYRFRDDAMILKDFLEKNELGDPFYVKTGWLRNWNRQQPQTWLNDVKISGGGVIMDMGIQLIDLSLWLLGNPDVSNVRTYSYTIFGKPKVEDSALIVIETSKRVVITVEVAWRLHLERDMNYTHVFGQQGSAFMNPLRLHKELHGNLVNVTPVQENEHKDVFKSAFVKEIRNFVEVIKGEAEPVTPADDGVYIMNIIDAIYESASQGKQIVLEN
jgi:predicted dehydrogenase